MVLFWCRGRLPEEGPEERDAHGGAPTWGVAVPALPSGSAPEDVACLLPMVTAQVMLKSPMTSVIQICYTDICPILSNVFQFHTSSFW